MADVLSKIQQVKTQLPARPGTRSSSSRPARATRCSTWLQFRSADGPQITDYITRVVQPRSADDRRRRQCADPRRPDLRHAHLARSDEDGGARRHAGRRAQCARRQQLHVRRRQIKNDYTQTSINALTSLDSATAFANLVVQARGDALVRLGDIARVELGPESADSTSVFDGLKAVFVGIYATPTANPLTVIDSCARPRPTSRRNCRPA